MFYNTPTLACMQASFPRPSFSYLPGLLLSVTLAALAYILAEVPGLSLLGTLGIALVLGVGWRSVFDLSDELTPGVRFSAKTLLNLGVILLGARLDFGLLREAGLSVLLLDVLVIGTGILVIERLGKAMGLSQGLRLALAVGSSICGPAAIAAAAPIIKARDDELSLSIGIVSLLGALGAVAFILVAPLLNSPHVYGLLTGASLQSVGHVIAAASPNPEALDIATVTKLTRVALLAPVLLLLGLVLQRSSATPTTRTKLPNVPKFLLGFLALGVVASLGVIPETATSAMTELSTLFTAVAMVGIGLGVDVAVLRRVGGGAVRLGVLGFGVILAVAGVYVTFVL